MIGLECRVADVPKILVENADLFEDVRTVLDIGAGTRRIAQFLLLRFSNIESYIAIEPHRKSCQTLVVRLLNDSRLHVVCRRWEEARNQFLNARFDVVILWNVLMFMDLRFLHNVNDPAEAAVRELDVMTRIAGKYFLFSLYPAKNSVIPPSAFRQILNYLDHKLKIVAKSGLHRVYRTFE